MPFIPKSFIPERFSTKTALKLRINSLYKKLFKHDFTESYSQLGEDIAIIHILNTLGIKKGFYIDVGCNQPQRGSNSYKLYLQHWNGLTIDLNQDLILKHKKERRKDIQIHAAVSDEVKEVIVYEFEDADYINTIEESIYQSAKIDYKPKTEFVRIETRTLNQILEEHKISVVDVLLIDVEGHDLNVLKSINLDIFRPKLIVVEFFIFDITKSGENELVIYLKSKGYTLYGYLIANGYFIDEKL
jgi:FkbM family methyltransferase